jgi:hypothetical protein
MTLANSDFRDIKVLVKAVIDEDETLVRKEDLKYLPSKKEFYNKMDEVVGELKAIREEHSMLSARVYDDHEPRIQKLEQLL